MAPYITISIFTLAGLIGWGLKGLVVGFVIGYLLTIIIGFIPLSKLGLGLIKKKFRIAIVKDFYLQNEKEILSLERFKSIDKEKIINLFANYITKIHEYANKLENPVKKYSGDLNVAGYRPNFIVGGKNWVDKFRDSKEREIMQKFVDFCEEAIYVNFMKYVNDK